MRHRMQGKQLSRNTKQRKALRLALVLSLLEHERITTTRAKAEFIRGHAEKLISIAKRGIAQAAEEGNEQRAIHARRIVGSRLNNDRVLVGKVFDDLAPRYAERNGGYTRLLKLGQRKGDAAEMVILELVDRTIPE